MSDQHTPAPVCACGHDRKAHNRGNGCFVYTGATYCPCVSFKTPPAPPEERCCYECELPASSPVHDVAQPLHDGCPDPHAHHAFAAPVRLTDGHTERCLKRLSRSCTCHIPPGDTVLDALAPLADGCDKPDCNAKLFNGPMGECRCKPLADGEILTRKEYRDYLRRYATDLYYKKDLLAHDAALRAEVEEAKAEASAMRRAAGIDKEKLVQGIHDQEAELAALRAEVVAAKSAASVAEADIVEWRDRCNALRAEVERVTDVAYAHCSRADAREADIERITAHYAGAMELANRKVSLMTELLRRAVPLVAFCAPKDSTLAEDIRKAIHE